MKQSLCEDKRKTCCDLYIGTDHVLLDPVTLEVLGSLERDSLTEVIKEIDSKIKDYDAMILYRTRMLNKGTGVPIYKGYNLKEGHIFSTLKGSQGVSIKAVADEVHIEMDFEKIPNRQDFNFRSVGTGVTVLDNSYKVGDVFHSEFRTIRSSDFDVKVDTSKTILVEYTKPDRDAIHELKTFNFLEYVEIVKNAWKLANDKLK